MVVWWQWSDSVHNTSHTTQPTDSVSKLAMMSLFILTFITNILATGQKGRPVKPKGGGPMEALNPTEVERLMAAEGYTDHCNLSTAKRLGVLGESWHLQTIVELLRPLAEHV